MGSGREPPGWTRTGPTCPTTARAATVCPYPSCRTGVRRYVNDSTWHTSRYRQDREATVIRHRMVLAAPPTLSAYADAGSELSTLCRRDQRAA